MPKGSPLLRASFSSDNRVLLVASALTHFVADHATGDRAADRAKRAAVGEGGTRDAADHGARRDRLLLAGHALATGKRAGGEDRGQGRGDAHVHLNLLGK